MWGVELAVMLAMIVVNSIFAAYEIALASIDADPARSACREQQRGAAAALFMKRNMEASLAVVQLGITLVGAVAAATGGAGAQESIKPRLIALGLSKTWAEVVAITLVVIPLTIVTIIVGELVPKLFALRNKEWVCLRLSPSMRWFAASVVASRLGAREVGQGAHACGANAAGCRPQTTRSEFKQPALRELQAVAALARTSRLIGMREEDIIVNAARLSTTPVREIMLPAQFISMLTVGNASLAECLIAAHHDMHTRFPVTERPGDPQAIVGYVNFKDIVACLRLSPPRRIDPRHPASAAAVSRGFVRVGLP